LENRLARFVEAFGNRLLADIGVQDIEAWLRSLLVGALTRNTYRLRLSSLFQFALAQGWCGKNPVASVAKAKVKCAEIGILKPEELARLLENADEQTLPYWALGAFAGLRSAELERLEWEDVHFDSALIEVKASKAKTASRRFIQIQDALQAWLAPYVDRRGNVCPIGLRKKLASDRMRAGLKAWPSNALRHSFASYHLARFQDAAKLALEMGHRDQRLVFAHYRELVRPAEAAKYWGIVPTGSQSSLSLAVA
jgi:integrase